MLFIHCFSERGRTRRCTGIPERDGSHIIIESSPHLPGATIVSACLSPDSSPGRRCTAGAALPHGCANCYGTRGRKSRLPPRAVETILRAGIALQPRPAPREVRIVGHQHAACKGGAASSFSPFTISVIWRSWPSVSPWRRQMAECDRSIGRGAFAQGGEDGNCGQLALLPRQQVALEDVAEQVFVQVPINDGGQRRHSPSWAHRQGRRSAFRAAPRRGCACRGCRRRGDASRPTVSAMPRALRSSSTCMGGGLQTTQAAGKPQ